MNEYPLALSQNLEGVQYIVTIRIIENSSETQTVIKSITEELKY